MNYPRITIFLYLLVATIPYFGAADKVDIQMLYLNILNCLNIFFFIKKYKEKFFSELIKLTGNLPVVLMGLFFLWSCLTIIPATNKVESLIALSEMLTILVALIFLIFHFTSLDKLEREKLIFVLIIALTSVELISIYYPYLFDIIQNGEPAFQSLRYRGIAGNINVMSYSLIFKLPFLIYYIFIRDKNRYLLYILIILLAYALFSILETRSAILTLVLITIILSIFFYYVQKSKNILKIFRNILLPISLGLFISFLTQSNFTSKTNIQDRMGTLLEVEQDQSINERLRYYKAAFQSFKSNPILGVGVGNWEIESLRYERINMDDYTVPYHAHNDYLEILAESGIPAVVLYFGTLFVIMLLTIKKILFNKIKKERDLFYIVILCSTSVYLIDSMFNFPQARIMSQMNLIFLLCISTFFIDLKVTVSHKLLRLISLFCLSLLPFSLYSSIKVYDSSIDQVILLRQFNYADFSKPSLEYIDKVQTSYPNITPTSMPIASIKAMFYMTNEQYEKAINLFKQGTIRSPHLYFSESFIGYSYEQISKRDSALYYSKMAFDSSPNDLIHFGNYMYALAGENDSTLVKETYLRVDENYRLPGHDEIYLLVMGSLKDPSSSKFSLDGIDINYQSGNDRLKKGYYLAQIGENKMYQADFYYQRALEDFRNENFEEAAQLFLDASELNPYEFVYLENAANSYMKIGKDKEALELLNKLLNDVGSKSAKAHYFRGLLLYELGEIVDACNDLKIANDNGLFATSELYPIFCGNQ